MTSRKHLEKSFTPSARQPLVEKFAQALDRDDAATVTALLLQRHVDLLDLFPSRDTPLVEAVENEKYLAADVILDLHPELLHAPGKNGFLPLTWISIGPDQARQIDYLVKKGADIGEKDADGETPLHWTDPTNTEALLRAAPKSTPATRRAGRRSCRMPTKATAAAGRMTEPRSKSTS